MNSLTGASALFLYGFLGAAGLFAITGVLIILSMYTGSELLYGYARFPFWMMLGLIGMLLNYLPIAKSKPTLIPMAGMIVVAGTFLWFCFDNLVKLSGLGDLVGRFRFDLALLILCYCLTHISLLMLTYQKRGSNLLLQLTCAAVLASGLGYLAILSGVAKASFFGITMVVTGCMFFIKLGMTIATVVYSLQGSNNESDDSIAG